MPCHLIVAHHPHQRACEPHQGPNSNPSQVTSTSKHTHRQLDSPSPAAYTPTIPSAGITHAPKYLIITVN